MEAFQGKGKSLFCWGETGAALKCVASLCNSTEAFQGPKGEQLLSVGTLQKKLTDWLVFFGAAFKQECGVSGTGTLGPHSTSMIHMEDIMQIIVERKSIAESCKGKAATGQRKAETAAAREQLAEAMTGLEPKRCKKQDAPAHNEQDNNRQDGYCSQ